jgi:hypothetical protein
MISPTPAAREADGVYLNPNPRMPVHRERKRMRYAEEEKPRRGEHRGEGN